MKISELTIKELRRALRATEQTIGPDAYESRALRRELERRIEAERRQRREVKR